MAAHSRPKDGVASLAYVAAIYVLLAATKKDVDAGHDEGNRCNNSAQRARRAASLVEPGAVLGHLGALR
jgi:hypothetical protein